MLVGGFHVNLHHSSEENVFKRHITYKHPSRHLFVEKINSAVRVPYYCQFNYRVSSYLALFAHNKTKSTYSNNHLNISEIKVIVQENVLCKCHFLINSIYTYFISLNHAQVLSARHYFY